MIQKILNDDGRMEELHILRKLYADLNVAPHVHCFTYLLPIPIVA